MRKQKQLWMKEGKRVDKLKVLIFQKVFAFDSNIKYCSSREFELLQVADFFAYSLNKTQMTLIKDKKTDFDTNLFGYLNNGLFSQKSFGTSIMEADVNNYSPDVYDYHQLSQRQIDDRLESWQKNNYG